MTVKKTTAKAAPGKTRRANPDAFEYVEDKETRSQALAELVTGGVLSAAALKRYSGGGDDLEIPDLVVAVKKAGDEAVAGNLSRVERMLSNQLLTLDAIFNNLAERAGRQETYKGIETLMRLGLKAQAQARATAEALAVIKNPAPYIKQANMTTGPQQVNNTYANPSLHTGIQSGAGNSGSEQNKLLEVDHGQRLDIGAQAQAGRGHQTLEAVGTVHRASDA